MNTSALKNFAQSARTKLIEQIDVQLGRALEFTGALAQEFAAPIQALEKEIARHGRQQVVEDTAYLWFNRFVALRFMDVNDYADLLAVSPRETGGLPELLQLAKANQLPEELNVNRQRINDLLDGRLPSSNPEAEIYRLLLRAECNRRHAQLPFLFQRIADFSELLLPADLLSQQSILQEVRDTLTADVCQDNEEVIGWLYQFYISEKKDAVFASKGRVKKEDIPAVTQLFTPRWIVEYMVQNTLGNLWLQNHPESTLRDQMPYYLESAESGLGELQSSKGFKEEQTDTQSTVNVTAEQLKTQNPKPQNLLNPTNYTLADQACGSGHILLYAFELLTKIYEESGYLKSEIPGLILTHNLTGFEIDERAAQLAAFTLMMRARRYHRSALRKGLTPNIVRFQDLTLNDGRELPVLLADSGLHFSKELLQDLELMRQATNFGSLITPTATTEEIQTARQTIQTKTATADIFGRNALTELERALGQLEQLNRTFCCVVDNPPYMGGGKMNKELSSFVKKYYPAAKNDIATCFILMALKKVKSGGEISMVTLDSWMFLSSFEAFRKKILQEATLSSMLHVGWNCFPEGHVYNRGTAFTITNTASQGENGIYVDLSKVPATVDKKEFLEKNLARNENIHHASQADFAKIPGSPVGYWVSDQMKKILTSSKSASEYGEARQGIATGKNDQFTKFWYEVSTNNISMNQKSTKAFHDSGKRFALFNKGGAGGERWYGTVDEVITFNKKDYEILSKSGNHLPSKQYYFQPGITFSKVTSSVPAFRIHESGIVFSDAGQTIFDVRSDHLLSFLNSSLSLYLLSSLSPTINCTIKDINNLPIIVPAKEDYLKITESAVSLSKINVNRNEAVHTYSSNRLMKFGCSEMSKALQAMLLKLSDEFKELHKLEERNNDFYIRLYSLQSELDIGVKLSDVYYLKNELDRKALTQLNKKLKRDPATGLVTNYDELELPFKRDEIMAQFVSYAVGCMMGRYSLDKEGLILANAGDTLREYAEKVGKGKAEWSFEPDDDGILPVLTKDYFPDDIVGRFRVFLQAAFGEDHFVENLAFVEECIGKDMRSYFVKDFYKDHVQRYKKRPIYWMFQSPDKYFRALVYLHRYQPDTVSRLLNDYLRPYIDRLTVERDNAVAVKDSATSSSSARAEADKTIEYAGKAIRDCEAYQKTLLDLARRRLELDLDDGVLVNYNKMGEVVETITGVNDAKGRKKVRGFDWVEFDWGE